MPIVCFLVIVWVSIWLTKVGVIFPLVMGHWLTLPQLVWPVLGCVLLAWCLDD